MRGPIERRIRPLALLVGLLTVVAACGDGTASPSASTVAVTSTTYVTIPARSTTTTAAPRPNDTTGSGDAAGDESESTTSEDPAQERIHEIESGDYLVAIARDYDVPINYIPEYNGWTDGFGHALVPGETIRIPPSDWLPEDERGAASTTETDDGSEPSGDDCDSYTIQRGDTKGAVAADHGVTVAELDAANANTQFYAGFVIGIEIIIPC